jgi:MSHA biogenesis protein MshQ
MKKHIFLLAAIATITLLFPSIASSSSDVSGTFYVDDSFEVYISTDDNVQGTLISSGSDAEAPFTLTTGLTPGEVYYLHIKAMDSDSIAGFIGDFTIAGTEHRFSNGLTTLSTNTSDWVVSKTGWSGYVAASSYGANDAGPRPNRADISASAEWIWSSDEEADNLTYFSSTIMVNNPSPLAEYKFAEADWNGTANEILDSSGNGYHARAVSNSIHAFSSPALSGNPGTCSYAYQRDGAIQVTGLPLDTTTDGVKTTVTFWMNWDGTESTMAIGWDKYNLLFSNGGMGFNTSNSDLYGVSNAGLANAWHHITLEFTNGSVASNRMYIDGVEQTLTQRDSTPINNLALVDTELRIGGWSNDDGYRFSGLIDEVRVYQGTLSTAQITTIMNERYTCPQHPIAEYRFDGLSWNGTAGEVFDNTENEHHGVAIGMTTTESGKICSAGDFTAAGTGDYLSLAHTALNGLDDFSVSVWVNINTLSTSAILSGASASSQNSAIMFYSGSTSFSPYINEISVNLDSGDVGDGNWHHVVWTRSGTDHCYYVDGALVQCGNIARTAALSIDPGGLIIGQEQDSVGGDFDVNQAWDGLLDELMIFDTTLSDTEVTDIYANQNAGKNYEGNTRVCPVPATRVVEYRFEEPTWDGTDEEVIDSSGNDLHGRVKRNSQPLTSSPAILGNPGTCGYASQTDGSIEVSGLPLDTIAINGKTSVTFWMNWDGTSGVMPISWNEHDIYMASDSIGFNTFGGDIYGFSSAGLANEWHHVAIEFTNGDIYSNRIYIDGVEQVLSQRLGNGNNARAYVDTNLTVGGTPNSASYGFKGLIDEFRVYDNALSRAEIVNIMADTHACPSEQPHHFEIEHDGSGLTCDAENVTIKACANENCTNLSTSLITLDFLGDGALISSKTFTGSTTHSFNNTDAEILTLSVANASVLAINPLVCNDSAGNSCDINFTDAGFRFLYGAGTNTTVANQIAGTTFVETLQLQAVKSNNGVCEGLFSGATTVTLSQENIDPIGTDGLSFSINGSNIDKHPLSSSVSLNFTNESIATIPAPLYDDAGKIRLHANYNAGGIDLVGSSNAFWVSPSQLVLSAHNGINRLNGSTANSAVTHKAGDDFTLSVSALNSLNTITPNYSPGQIQLALKRTGPLLSESVNGNLSYANASSLSSSINPTFENVILSDFSEGVSTFNTAQYSEVGLLNLDVQDSDFGGEGIIIPATAVSIGRFVPHHFEQTIAENGLFQASCDSAISFTAYSGQKDQATSSKGAISYLTNPVLQISAFNKQGDITENYFEDSQGSANDFMKLDASAISIVSPTVDEDATGIDTNKLPIIADMDTGTLSQNDLTVLPNIVALPKGVLHYQLSSDDNFYYQRSANTIVQPFTANIDFPVTSIIDTDNVPATSTEDASPTGVEVYFGRLVLNNSYGPETEDLAQSMQVEYFQGTGFVLSSNDNCLAYDASKLTLSNISLDPSLTAVDGGVGRFNAGKTNAILLEAPGIGNQGELGLEYDAYEWLKYDWDNDGVHDDSPSAKASFGLYRGDDNLFHWRENL